MLLLVDVRDVSLCASSLHCLINMSKTKQFSVLLFSSLFLNSAPLEIGSVDSQTMRSRQEVLFEACTVREVHSSVEEHQNLKL